MGSPAPTQPDACTGREACLGRQIYVLFHMLMRRCDEVAQDIGLTTSKWLLLCSVASEEGEPTIGQLSERSMLSTQAVSKMIALMESDGLVTRHSKPGGGRSVYVRMTDEGRQTLTQTDSIATRIESQLLAGLSQEDTDRIGRDLQRLIDNMARTQSQNLTPCPSEPTQCEASS